MEQDAAPAGSVVSRTLGGLGTPPYGHYDPCARSSLDASRQTCAGTPQARPEVKECRSRAPEGAPPRSQGEAARLASVPGRFAAAPGARRPRVFRRSAPLTWGVWKCASLGRQALRERKPLSKKANTIHTAVHSHCSRANIGFDDMLSWDDFRYVKAIADTRSLGGAAQELSVNHSTVFRRLAQIEKQLGSRLFERSRGGYALTPCGEEMVRLAERMGEDIVSFERQVTGHDLRPSGELRVTTND